MYTVNNAEQTCNLVLLDERITLMLNRHILTIAVEDQDINAINDLKTVSIINQAQADDFTPDNTSLPLSREEAWKAMDSDGYASAVATVNLETFMSAGDSSIGEDDIYDILHEITFGDFGITSNSGYQVLGVTDGNNLIVRYSTHLSPFFSEEEDPLA